MITVTRELDTDIFGDEAEWCEEYLKSMEGYEEEAYEGLIVAERAFEYCVSNSRHMKDSFSLAFSFQGDSGPQDQATLEYMRRLGESGIVQVFEVHDDYIIMVG